MLILRPFRRENTPFLRSFERTTGTISSFFATATNIFRKARYYSALRQKSRFDLNSRFSAKKFVWEGVFSSVVSAEERERGALPSPIYDRSGVVVMPRFSA